MNIGIGDSFTYQREHWMIVDIKEDSFVCKNKKTCAVVEFNKNVVKKLIE